MEKYHMGVIRESIPKPWDDVALILIKYVMFKGRYKVLLESHLYLLYHFIFPDTDKVNFPFFIFNSLAILVEKVKQERAPLPLHGAIIKLVLDKAMDFAPRNIPRVKLIIYGRLCEPKKRVIYK